MKVGLFVTLCHVEIIMFCKHLNCVARYRNYIVLRYFSHSCNNEQLVRVRFAPSPTGYLHLGGLRTALYNYLFAKSCNGKMILRIEDTDQSRLVPGAIAKLEEDLNWAGIISDESPSAGGDYGPYIQSERLQLYKNSVQFLLERREAYRCFCTDKRLDLLRREALRARQVPKYDNRCRHLTAEEIEEKMSKNVSHCVRFKLIPLATEFNDLVYGAINSDACTQEGDPVIFKTDGFPTYHLANVVDDHAMAITHVLRGVEWQISTQKHIQLYRAFGWEAPQFAHLPLILNADGSKLSKRQGDVRVEHFKADGIFPLALVNYVTNAGGGFERLTAKPSSYTLEHLANQFDLSLINTNSCRLMPERLLQCNALELDRRLQNEAQTVELVSEVKRLVTQTFADQIETSELQLHDEHIQNILTWSRKRIQRIGDLVGKDLAFLWVVPKVIFDAQKGEFNNETLKNLQTALQDTESFELQNLKQLLREFATRHNVPFNKLMKSLRETLSGLKEGPGVAEMMSILGRESTIARLERIITIYKKGS